MKNKKIIFLSLGLLLIVTTLVVSISAWLTDTDSTPETVFTIGDVEYELTGSFIGNTAPIVPGQQLIAEASGAVEPFKLTNSSTVKSEVRILVTLVVKDSSDTIISLGLSDLFTTTGASGGGFALDTGWVFDTGYYYYKPDSESVVLPTTTTPFSFLSSLMLDGSKVGNAYSNYTITITLTFQAKQAEYVTWSDLGSINFTTGLA